MQPIKSAQRVCEIFEFFNEVKRPVALKEVVARFGYPASSCSGLLKSLVVMGYIDYDLARRTYCPTMRMSSMIDWIEHARFGNGMVLAAMKQLHAATSETVSLGVQSDLHAQYVYQVPGTLPFPYPRLRQTIRPLAKSGLGWLLLSALEDAAIEHLVKRINYAERRSRNRTDLKDLMGQITQIRRNGHVFSKHTVLAGAGMIGMLVPVSKGDRPLALSVHGPVQRLEEKEDMILRRLSAVTSAAGVLGANGGGAPGFTVG